MTGPRASRPLRRQLVLATSALSAGAMLLLVLLVQLVLHRVVDENIDSVLQDRARVARSALEDSASPPSATELEELVGGVAVFDAQGRLVAGTVPRGSAAAAAELAAAGRQRTVEVKETTRLLAVPFEGPGARGVIVASESITPYERAEAYALVVSISLGLVTVAGVGALTAWTVRRSLAPVATMAATADDWSAHDLGRRFELGPPTNEITALGATMDRLLERVARALRAEQRLTSEVAHELRTPLTAVLGAADVALLRPDLDPRSREAFVEIANSARRMADTVTMLVDLARSGDGTFAESSTLGEVLAAIDTSGVQVDVPASARDVVLGTPALLAVRALAPVLDNARSHRRSVIHVSAREADSHVDLVVEDDGPGLADGDAITIFEAGVRGPSSSGAGLGLPLARRIARAAGGDVMWEPSEVGACFVVRLPRR